ncbi:putative methyltransferase DDB_G0268948 [Mercenaria mercenaria]|uniref:putative methyltransferase DDB_G0268948 n=1 Tax=Mercenaria mercenaria TaxID=6596 RepID=UPI00234E6E9F|nr:putative methyltransferase DDB_G0268948 [Mercenaria mercenaria]
MIKSFYNHFVISYCDRYWFGVSIIQRAMSIRLFDGKEHAELYAQYRPTYPSAVYTTIEEYYNEHKGALCNTELAVDVGCGNGQSTVPLCKLFKRVIGYDVSEQQISSAPKGIANLTFKVGSGEDLGFLKDNEVDLITIAQALHWMDLENFYSEVRRVVKPGGVFAAYGYGNNVVDKVNAQDVVNEFYRDLLGTYWDKQRKHIDEHYRRMSHPFTDWKRVENDDIAIRRQMPVEAYIGYLSTWSAWRSYLKKHPGSDALEKVKEKIEVVYKGSDISVQWPVFMLIGRK